MNVQYEILINYHQMFLQNFLLFSLHYLHSRVKAANGANWADLASNVICGCFFETWCGKFIISSYIL
jgi:hypothetical protein